MARRFVQQAPLGGIGQRRDRGEPVEVEAGVGRVLIVDQAAHAFARDRLRGRRKLALETLRQCAYGGVAGYCRARARQRRCSDLGRLDAAVQRGGSRRGDDVTRQRRDRRRLVPAARAYAVANAARLGATPTPPRSIVASNWRG